MPKTICFINTSKIWGGGEVWQVETIVNFKDRVHAVSISNPQSKLFSKIKNEGVETMPFYVNNFSFLNPFKIYEAYKLLKKIKPHAIMFNTNNDFKLFSIPAKKLGIKYILYRRDNGKKIKKHILNTYLLKNGITHFLPCSEFIKNAALSKNQNIIPLNRIRVINNSINLTKWDNEQPAPLTVDNPQKKYIFGCIGRLSPEKGQQMLLKTIIRLKELNNSFKLLIAGSGPSKNELEKMIKKHNLENYVDLLGYVDSNKAFLQAIDCLIIPSYWEGLPTSAIEAMAVNKPVIAFDVAGNPEVVIDNNTGILIKPFDLEDLAHRMNYVMEHPEEAIVLGKRGRDLIEKKFSREVNDNLLNEFFL